jgi:hypothetical protein
MCQIHGTNPRLERDERNRFHEAGRSATKSRTSSSSTSASLADLLPGPGAFRCRSRHLARDLTQRRHDVVQLSQ